MAIATMLVGAETDLACSRHRWKTTIYSIEMRKLITWMIGFFITSVTLCNMAAFICAGLAILPPIQGLKWSIILRLWAEVTICVIPSSWIPVLSSSTLKNRVISFIEKKNERKYIFQKQNYVDCLVLSFIVIEDLKCIEREFPGITCIWVWGNPLAHYKWRIERNLKHWEIRDLQRVCNAVRTASRVQRFLQSHRALAKKRRRHNQTTVKDIWESKKSLEVACYIQEEMAGATPIWSRANDSYTSTMDCRKKCVKSQAIHAVSRVLISWCPQMQRSVVPATKLHWKIVIIPSSCMLHNKRWLVGATPM